MIRCQRKKTLLVDSGQDSVVLAQAFESLRFPLEQVESFSDLSCLTCAQQAVRLASSASNLARPCNGRTWNAKGIDAITTSPERQAPKTSTKRTAALPSPTGIKYTTTLFGVLWVFIAWTIARYPQGGRDGTTKAYNRVQRISWLESHNDSHVAATHIYTWAWR